MCRTPAAAQTARCESPTDNIWNRFATGKPSPAPHTHYVEVSVAVPTSARRLSVDLMMAVWTPGSYLIREYARHVEGIAAVTPPEGRQLLVEEDREKQVDDRDRGGARL